MSSFHHYSSIYGMGHAAIADLLKGPVYVEEKIDGSQFSFGMVRTSELERAQGEKSFKLRVRSKGYEMLVDAPEKMFSLAVETAKALEKRLYPGWTYRCEYLRTPKHNALAYDRVPAKHLIVFDIETAECQFLSYQEKAEEAAHLGLEVVPLLEHGMVNDINHFRSLLDRTSVLGGQKIEGVVVKPHNYDLFGRDKKVLMGKFVSEAFKETHSREWSAANPTTNDIVGALGNAYCTQGRWQKALQHLRERGKITDAVQDIGLLMKEIPTDIRKECEDEIKEELFKFAWPHICRRVTRGVPEWYKDLLLRRQFENYQGD